MMLGNAPISHHLVHLSLEIWHNIAMPDNKNSLYIHVRVSTSSPALCLQLLGLGHDMNWNTTLIEVRSKVALTLSIGQ